VSTLKGIIVKDDPRYDYLENYLRKNGIYTTEAIDEIEKQDFIIFPFKKEIDEEEFDDKFFENLKGNTVIFSGLRKKYLEEKCRKYSLKYYVLMEDKSVSIMNAIPTSEGVIANIIDDTTKTIYNMSILIIGYGVCGQDLARRLKALDANVSTLVRSEEKEYLARTRGITPVFAEKLNNQKYDVIVNTVPDKILTKEQINKFKDSLIIDIASIPHGFDVEYMKKIGANYKLILGIPGKYAVEYAGEILAKKICERMI
jgi:dipicolinate synthase subunit A